MDFPNTLAGTSRDPCPENPVASSSGAAFDMARPPYEKETLTPSKTCLLEPGFGLDAVWSLLLTIRYKLHPQNPRRVGPTRGLC